MGEMEICIRSKDFYTAFEKWEQATARWKNEWFKTCEIIYEKVPTKVRDKFIYHPKLKTFERAEKIKISPNAINWIKCEPLKDEKGKQQVYVVEFFDCHNNIIYGKVGTTTRTVKARLREELKAYNKDKVKKVNVYLVADCGQIEAEGLESYLRAKCIKDYPHTFRKNDRFVGVDFDIDRIKKYVKEYLETT